MRRYYIYLIYYTWEYLLKSGQYDLLDQRCSIEEFLFLQVEFCDGIVFLRESSKE